MTNPIGLTPEKSAQLALGLHVNDVDDDAADREITPEMALQISNSARAALEDGSVKGATWVEEYQALRADGWNWRIAAYIAWAATPRQVGDVERWPGTQLALAREVLGLRSDRVIRVWRQKNHAIDEAVALLQMARLEASRGDIIAALVESATSPDYKAHADRRVALEMLGAYTPRQETTLKDRRGAKDLSTLSDAELDELAGARTGDDTNAA